jgi:5-methylcytosine-specific restriction protein A
MPIPNRLKIKVDLLNLLILRGAMRTTEVYGSLAAAWGLSLEEKAFTRSGGRLYQHEIRWARQELTIQGLILRPGISGRGLWRVAGINPPQKKEDDGDLTNEGLTEGAVSAGLANTYERNHAARQACLHHFGYTCCVCAFDFELKYGPIGKHCIHVHHLKEISSIGKEYVVDPLTDLVPVCPNCHYMIHRRRPAFTPSEVRRLIGEFESV